MLKTLLTNESNVPTSCVFSLDDCLVNSVHGLIYSYCVASLTFLIGTPSHSWCLWFYLRDGWRIKANQMFPFHHTIVDLIACIENAIQIVNNVFLENTTVTRINYFIFGVSWTGRPLIQMCICIEQYIAVIHPIIFLKYKAMKYKLAGVVTVYLISSCYGVYELICMNFPELVFNLIYAVVVVTVLYCCVSVLCALKTSGLGDKHGNRSTAQEEPNQQKKKAFNIICTNVCIMLLTYVPVLVLTLSSIWNNDKIYFICVLDPILASLSSFSLVITPLLKMYKEGYLRCSNS